MAQVTASPLQGLLGGVSIAFSVSLLLLVNGSTFGVSGFLHRSVRKDGSWEDRLAVLGLLLGGICVGVAEKTYGGATDQSTTIMLGQGTLLRAALAGFLAGIGSRLQNGCTSGHMVCGISRFSKRSLLATSIFVIVASITSHIHHAYLPHVTGYDWTLAPLGLPLLVLEGLGFAALLILYGLQGLQSQSRHGTWGIRKITSLGVALLFGLGLRLSTLTSAVTVTAFLISPIPDSAVFNPTLIFLALSALPISAGFYQLASRYRRPNDTVPNAKDTGSTRPLLDVRRVQGAVYQPPTTCGEVPNAEDNTGSIDRTLIAGAVLFGLGWGLEGICPGPALVNIGRYIHAIAIGEEVIGVFRLSAWLVAFITGGYFI